LGERRLCTAEVRGSNPLGSTPKMSLFAGKKRIALACFYLRIKLLAAVRQQ
jgi:hypothetical protein